MDSNAMLSFIQPHKTPDSGLEMKRQPGGLKQLKLVAPRSPRLLPGEVSLFENDSCRQRNLRNHGIKGF